MNALQRSDFLLLPNVARTFQILFDFLTFPPSHVSIWLMALREFSESDPKKPAQKSSKLPHPDRSPIKPLSEEDQAILDMDKPSVLLRPAKLAELMYDIPYPQEAWADSLRRSRSEQFIRTQFRALRTSFTQDPFHRIIINRQDVGPVERCLEDGCLHSTRARYVSIMRMSDPEDIIFETNRLGLLVCRVRDPLQGSIVRMIYTSYIFYEHSLDKHGTPYSRGGLTGFREVNFADLQQILKPQKIKS